jgi:hypothetical protein
MAVVAGWFDVVALGPTALAVLGHHVSEPQVRVFTPGRNVHVQAHPPPHEGCDSPLSLA